MNIFRIPSLFNKHRYRIHFRFLGWTDDMTEKKYQNSVRRLFLDISNRKTPHNLDASIMMFDYEGDNALDGGTPRGSIIEALYDNRKTNPEHVESFLNAVGLHIQRADPFFFMPSVLSRIIATLLAPMVVPLAFIVLLFHRWSVRRNVEK